MGHLVVKSVLKKGCKCSECDFFLLNQVDLPLFFSVHFLYSLQKVTWTKNTETPGSNTLAGFDPRPAGLRVKGLGATMS